MAKQAPRPIILLVTPWICRAGGGVAEVARLLAHALARRGDLHIEIVTLKTPHLEADRRGWPDVPIHAFRAYGPANYGFSPGMALHLLRRPAGVAHVHGIWMFPCVAVWLWGLLRGGRYVVSPHGMLDRWILARSVRRKWLVSVLYQNRFLRRAAAIHALTTKEARDVAEVLGPIPACVIPNFTPMATPSAAPPGWVTAQMAGRQIFLFLGRIHDKKGWRDLCEAWDGLCTRDAGFAAGAQLVFCGWPDGCPDFAAVLHRLGNRHGNAIHAGPLYGAAKQASLAAADFLVLPSKSEGLPMVVLEAWAAGLPCVMTSACNLDLGFTAGAALQTGQTAPEIAITLATAAAMPPAEHAAMRMAAWDLARGAFCEAAVVDRITALYDVPRRPGSEPQP